MAVNRTTAPTPDPGSDPWVGYSPDCRIKPLAIQHEASDVLELIASIHSFAQSVHPVAWQDFASAVVYLMDGISRYDDEMAFASEQYASKAVTS